MTKASDIPWFILVHISFKRINPCVNLATHCEGDTGHNNSNNNNNNNHNHNQNDND